MKILKKSCITKMCRIEMRVSAAGSQQEGKHESKLKREVTMETVVENSSRSNTAADW